MLQRLAISVQYGPGERCLDSPSFALCPLVVRNRMCGNKYYAGFCCRSHIYVTVSASDICISRSCTAPSSVFHFGQERTTFTMTIGHWIPDLGHFVAKYISRKTKN